MSAWFDQVIVGVLVIASAAFACYRLGPQNVRFWMRRQWARIRGKPLPQANSGGGGCGDCPNAAPLKARGEARVAANNIRKLER